MRRQRLAPPADRSGMLHQPLPEPAEAHRRHRRLFRPVTGWFRRLERWVNQTVSRRLYPGLPGLPAVYGRILRKRLTVSEADIPVPGLGRSLDGLRVLLVSDVHCGPFLCTEVLAETFRRLMTLQPDLVLLAGDLATSRLDEFRGSAPAFRILQAGMGVWAVLGNHDHYTGEPGELCRELERQGVALLQNRHVVLERDGDRLVLAGIDDLAFGRPDLQEALRHRPESAPVVLVSHNPDVFFDAAGRGVSLVLSGHTHGGQIRIPGLPVLVRMSRYRLDEGRYQVAGAELVVSRGLGVVGLPFRLACPPEAVLLTLKAGCGPANLNVSSLPRKGEGRR